MLLTCSLCLQLEAFLERWRAELKPSHSFVFTMRYGAPMTAQGVHRLFVSACYRLVRYCRPFQANEHSCWPLFAALCLMRSAPSHTKYAVIAQGVTRISKMLPRVWLSSYCSFASMCSATKVC